MIEPLRSDEALLTDVASAPADPRVLSVWWLGQSGILISHAGRRVLFDPYLSDSLTRKYEKTEKPHVRMSRRVVDPAGLRGIDVVTSTHGHTDHLDAETLAAVRAGNRATLVAPRGERTLVEQRWGAGDVRYMNASETCDLGGFEVRAVRAAHPDHATDAEGNDRYLGFVVRLGQFTVYHSGDTLLFDGMAEELRPLGPFDLAILPINGKVNNMDGADAARLAKAIGARIVIPCHYHLFEFNTAEPSELFVPECERLGQAYRVLRLGERLTLEASPP